MTRYLSLKLRILSFIMMIMVVFVHSYNIAPYSSDIQKLAHRGPNSFLQHFVAQEAARVALRTFFCISGYLFFIRFECTLESYSGKLKKRWKALGAPYLCWSFLWIIFYFLLQSFGITRPLFEGTLVAELSFKGFMGTLLLHPIPFQLWSIRELAVLAVLSPCVYYAVSRLRYLPAALLLVAWYLDLNFYILSNESIFFFTLGASMSILGSKAVGRRYQLRHVPVALAWLCICTAASVLDYWNLHATPAYYLLHKAGIIFGIGSVWVLYDIFPKIRHIDKKSYFRVFSMSFFIYAFHIPFITFVRRLLFKFVNGPLGAMGIFLIAPVIVVLASLAIGFLLRRKFPGFYSLLSGGR